MNSELRAGFTRLLRSFDDNPDDVVQITRAFGLATKAHKGQHSENKYEHYISHSLRVALILAEELKIHDTDLVCAALLHDGPKKRPQKNTMPVSRKRPKIPGM